MDARSKASRQTARAERLRAALRENLKRRKAQARAREAEAAKTAEPELGTMDSSAGES